MFISIISIFVKAEHQNITLKKNPSTRNSLLVQFGWEYPILH